MGAAPGRPRRTSRPGLGELLGLEEAAFSGPNAEGESRPRATSPSYRSSPSSPVNRLWASGVAAAGNDSAPASRRTRAPSSTYLRSASPSPPSRSNALTNRHDPPVSPADDWGLTGMGGWTKVAEPDLWGIGGKHARMSAKSTMDYQTRPPVRARQPAGCSEALYAGAGLQLRTGTSACATFPAASGQPTGLLEVPLRHWIDFAQTPVRHCPSSGTPRDSPVLPQRAGSSRTSTTLLPDLARERHHLAQRVPRSADLPTQLAPWLVLALWTYGSFHVRAGAVPRARLETAAIPTRRAARGYIQGRHIGENRSSTAKRSSDSPSGNGWAQSPG